MNIALDIYLLGSLGLVIFIGPDELWLFPNLNDNDLMAIK